jgi:serine/threonine-protein kinase ULK4
MDRYHIYEAIGKGKHSVVYKGRRKKTIQYYAIKSIDKSQRSRVLREVQVLRATNSAYVLKFHAWYETANHLWLVLEYCVGGDLLGLLKQDVRLPEASIKTFGKDLVTALRVAHEAGVLHCDLKPSNLLIDEDGRIKLCGFGLAKKVSEVVFFGGAGDDGTAATKSNGDGPGSAPAKKKSKLVGTPCYMAPELFGEHGVHSYASDLWAIGCVLYECAFGVPPFVSSSLSDLMEMILNDDPGGFDGMGAVDGKNLDGNERVGGTDAEPNVTKNFADLVQGLLNKDPSRRMNWETLLMHPFWVDGEKENANAKETENARWKSPPRKPLPAQNAFDAAVAASVRAELGDDAERFGVTQKRTVGNVSVDREHCENPIAPRSPTREKSETEAAARREPRAKTFPKLVRASGSKSAEVVRLSLAARANLEREEGGASYADTGGRGCFVENGRDRAVSEILSPEKVTGAGDSVENNPSPWWKAKSSCTAAGDVSLADADAELNFSEGVFCVAEEETDGGGVTGGKDEHEGARFLSGGGAEDGDSPVSRSKNVFEKSALFSEQKLGERELTDIVSDPGPDVAAAAAEGERQAAAAEEREAAAASREVDDRQTDGGATTDGAPFSAARGADAASPSPNSKQRSPPARPEKDAVEHELDHRISVLLDHPSDSQVKPIVLNRRIEINPPPVWDENALPFAALTATQMLAATQTDLELFLTKVYRSVAHSSPINEKVNTLSYFETLCCDTASANVLINSSLMTLFVRMLRASKAPALRVRLTSVMGLLLRHATYITPELASSGIVSVLTECLRDKNDKVRRRAAATLGELLFYIATQQHEAACAAANRGAKKKTSAPAKNTKDDDDATRAAVAAAAAADAWRIPASTVGTLLRTLRAGEDEIAQHYAVKTVENIVSHGGEWSAKVRVAFPKSRLPV